MGWVRYSPVLVHDPRLKFEKFSVQLEQEVSCGWISHLLRDETLIQRLQAGLQAGSVG